MTNKEMIEPWRQYGVRLEKEDTVDGVTHLYISVPKMSDFFDDNGNELSGALLAKRVKMSAGQRTCPTTSITNRTKRTSRGQTISQKQATMICLIFLISSLDMGTKIHSLNERSV